MTKNESKMNINKLLHPQGLADSLHLQALNNATANSRLIQACKNLSAFDLTQTRVSFFPSLFKTFNHIYVVDLYYMDGVMNKGQGPKVWFDYKDFTDFKTFAEERRKLDLELIEFCKKLTEPDIHREVILDRGPKGKQKETIFTVLSHNFIHQTHHRGQIHAMLSGTPVAPPQLDEFYLLNDQHLTQEDFRIYDIKE